MVTETKEVVKAPAYMWRIQKAKDRALMSKPRIDLEPARILTESFMQTEGEPKAIRVARAFKEQCERKTINIREDELIVGCVGTRIRGGVLCPDTCWPVLDKELDTLSTRTQDPFEVTPEDKKLFREFIKPYWQGKSLLEAWYARMPEEVRRLKDQSVIFCDLRIVRGPGELTADYEFIINEGINNIRRKVEQRLAACDLTTYQGYNDSVYLNALLITCDGMLALAKRYSLLAAKLAAEEKDPRRKAELEKIAEVCERVPANPACSFQEAIQSFYFYHTCIQMQQQAPSYNPGRMDQYLYPYYKKDIEAGRLAQDEAQELLDCLWVKFSESCLFQDTETAKYAAGYMLFQNTCCGGITLTGQDAVNDVSYMMLQATTDVQLYQPSISIRYNKEKNPDAFLRKVADLVALGMGFPSIHSDEVGIKMVLHKGVPMDEAWNWNPCGCVETNLAGKMRTYTDYAHMNMGAAFEFALTDGILRLNSSEMGARTGDPRRFKTYQEFEDAVKAQLAFLIKKAIEINQVMETVVGEMRPVPVVSLSFKECIDRAKDYDTGGPKYSLGNGISLIAVADIVDSLMVVKKLIYDEKSLAWDKLLAALEKNFEGYQDVRKMCLAVPKYGNDIPEVDEIAADVIQFTAEEIGKYRGKHGRMIAGILPVTGHIPGGMVVGALPSGRKAGVPLSDGLSPMQSTDINGPTAILKSVSRINHTLFGSGTLLNMKLDPSLFKEERGKTILMNLLKSMCDLGVYHIQINVVSAETLKDAQKHPEKHRNLMVRVAGYTAYFVELEKAVQDEIISRTTQTTLK